MVIHTGTIKVNKLNDYWKNNTFIIFLVFQIDRFFKLLRCFHFSPNIEINNQNKSYDRLYNIIPLITYFKDKMNTIYYPKKELSLNESIVL